MNRTVTATYVTHDALRNAMDDLVGAGIPREKIFAIDEENQVKVITPEATEPLVLDLLGRHRPKTMDHRPGPDTLVA